MQMKTLLVGTVAAIATAGTLTACGSSGSPSSSPATPTASAAAPASAGSRSGTFTGLNGKHVAGTATISGSTLTLTGYSSDQGPDLHVYLTHGTTESDVSSGIEISKVNYNQTQTFTLPAGSDASMFTYVVIHCDKAKAVFGAASLS